MYLSIVTSIIICNYARGIVTVMADASLDTHDKDRYVQGLRLLARIIARKHLDSVRPQTDSSRKNGSSKELDKA